ncbi:MAG: hypothetical protein JJU22_11035 [Gammaproteobacteria bacterium]|nr:hypothetical protein [Gammaproteobacteria bacterium]
MPCIAPRSAPLLRQLQSALHARSEELTHATALGRRHEVLEDICVQLLFDHHGMVPEWDDVRLKALLREAVRFLDP